MNNDWNIDPSSIVLGCGIIDCDEEERKSILFRKFDLNFISLKDIKKFDVADPTLSGTLEYNMNTIRSVIKELKGDKDWYDYKEEK